MVYDVVILGGSVSGMMMAKRLSMTFPELSVLIIDKKELKIHPFHIHRLINLPGLDNITPVALKVNVWDGCHFKQNPTILDINRYAWKTFDFLQITNIHNVEDQKIYPVGKQALIDIIKGGNSFWEGSIVGVDLEKRVVRCHDVTEGEKRFSYHYLISTIPLPDLLKFSGIDSGIEFKSYPFYTSHIFLPETQMYQMIYNVAKECGITRTTLLGDHLFIESFDNKYTEKDLDYIGNLYGISGDQLPELKLLTPGRLKLVSQEERKPLFYWLTEKFNVFVLGRYGAWTFKITNDIWDDTAQISGWIYSKEQAHKFEKGRSHGIV